MSTTSLFVELLVIGAGATIWVSLLVLAFFGVEWLPASANKDLALPMLLPALSVTYVLGILVDRIADHLFEGTSNRLRAERFRSREDYRHARTLIYVKSESLKDLFEYGRSRLRICRGWTINAVLILVCLDAFLLLRVPSGNQRVRLVVFATTTFGLFAYGLWAAWRGLTVGEHTLLQEQRNFLRQDQGQAAQRRS